MRLLLPRARPPRPPLAILRRETRARRHSDTSPAVGARSQRVPDLVGPAICLLRRHQAFLPHRHPPDLLRTVPLPPPPVADDSPHPFDLPLMDPEPADGQVRVAPGLDGRTPPGPARCRGGLWAGRTGRPASASPNEPGRLSRTGRRARWGRRGRPSGPGRESAGRSEC